MRPSRIKAKLNKAEPVLLTQLHFTDPSVYELTSLMGFDGIWMDMEHHGYSLETANGLMRAARVGSADVLVRPAKWEYMRIGRMLEAGAQGIMYPRCSDAAEAAEVVRWSKFAPLGTRGFDGGNPDMPYCTQPIADYLKAANRETFVVVQIEDPQALENAGKIAAVEGVDALLFGPADFSILSGVPGQWDHPKIKDAVRRIAEACRAAGKQWGQPVGTVEQAKALMDLGARFFCCGADIIHVMRALERIQSDFATLGFTFDNRLM
jgi:4-hydroxy-2-oxoheptanedioate aldolase